MKDLLAQKIENPVGPKFESGTSFFQSFIPALIGTGFVLGVLFFFFYMMIGAIQLITSGGDKTALEGARGKITSAIVGVVLLLSVLHFLRLLKTFSVLTYSHLTLGL